MILFIKRELFLIQKYSKRAFSICACIFVLVSFILHIFINKQIIFQCDYIIRFLNLENLPTYIVNKIFPSPQAPFLGFFFLSFFIFFYYIFFYFSFLLLI